MMLTGAMLPRFDAAAFAAPDDAMLAPYAAADYAAAAMMMPHAAAIRCHADFR